MSLDNVGNESHQKRHGLLKDLVRIFKKKNSARHEIVPILEPLSFDKGFFVVIRACQLLAQKNDGIILVGVAGPSGAGKSVFTEKILNFMPSIAVISMDNYNDSSRIVDGNFDDPRLTDYDTLLENVQDLKEGKQVEVPIYDFKSSSRVGYRFAESVTSLGQKYRCDNGETFVLNSFGSAPTEQDLRLSGWRARKSIQISNVKIEWATCKTNIS